jgi:hypothetical protein
VEDTVVTPVLMPQTEGQHLNAFGRKLIKMAPYIQYSAPAVGFGGTKRPTALMRSFGMEKDLLALMYSRMFKVTAR